MMNKFRWPWVRVEWKNVRPVPYVAYVSYVAYAAIVSIVLVSPCTVYPQTFHSGHSRVDPVEVAQPGLAAIGTLIKDADLFLQQQRYENAVALLSAGVAQGITHPSIWLRLGNGLHHLHQFDNAQAYYRLAARHPLPDTSQIGYLEATRLRSKALLNLASLNLTLANHALTEFRSYGMASGEQNLVLQEQARLTEMLGNSSPDRPSPLSLRNAAAPLIRSKTSALVDNTVTVEYLSGGPALLPKLPR